MAPIEVDIADVYSQKDEETKESKRMSKKKKKSVSRPQHNHNTDSSKPFTSQSPEPNSLPVTKAVRNNTENIEETRKFAGRNLIQYGLWAHYLSYGAGTNIRRNKT